MFDRFRQFFRKKPSLAHPAIPAGRRVYAVGDIHGRLDLFAQLVAAIERDDAARGGGDTTIVLLGDLIDRGADSAGVIAAARALGNRRELRIVAGNHEEMFLRSFDDTDILRHFLRFGGRETLLSYSLDKAALRRAALEDVQAMMRGAVPAGDLEFIRSFEDSIAIGDYLFVHAGIRPGVSLAEQDPQDLRWIREPFLSHAGDHGRVVVHGHTITPQAELLRNRIGIDTGAYMSGRLTALGLEGARRWLIEASGAADGDEVQVAVLARPAVAGKDR